ncbi:hypothetical protein ABNQ39_13200 [Azospirillum sp. A26]|uniref:hypothetical protein n=1 Tax=Azospirillum sp. A26 TaxID=3160607 RepID=UPI0036715849
MARRPIIHTLVVGYIRSGSTIKSSILSDEQEELICEWSREQKAKVLGIYADAQFDQYGIKISLPSLEQALECCEKTGATFVYVTLGQKRKSAILNRLIDEKSRGGAAFKVVSISQNFSYAVKKKFISARPRIFIAENGKKIVRLPPDTPDAGSPLSSWVRERKMSSKRYKNFVHFLKNHLETKIEAYMQIGLTDREIADELTKMGVRSAYGKIWTKQNIQKLREAIKSESFKEFKDVWNMQKDIEECWLNESDNTDL